MKKDWLRFFNSLDGLVSGHIEEFRSRLVQLSGLVRKPFGVFAEYLIDLSKNGSDHEVKKFWRYLHEGARLPEADGLQPFDPRFPQVPLNLAWSVRAKA